MARSNMRILTHQEWEMREHRLTKGLPAPMREPQTLARPHITRVVTVDPEDHPQFTCSAWRQRAYSEPQSAPKLVAPALC